MTFKTYTQRNWTGIARTPPYDREADSSLMEINTEPGKGQLKRLNSRVPYLDSAFPAPAIRFNNTRSFLKTETADSSTFKLFDYGTHGDEHQLSMIFKLNDMFEIDFNCYLFQCGQWYSYFNPTSGELKVVWYDSSSSSHNTTLFSTVTFKPETWYWLYFASNGAQKVNATLGEGSDYDKYTETDVLDCSPNHYQNSGGPVYLGNSKGPISIAYFAYYGSLDSYLTPSEAELLYPDAQNHAVHFLPRDPRKTIFSTGLDASTSKASFVLYPRPGIEYSEVPSGEEEDNVKGLRTRSCRGHRLSLSSDDLFSQRTVFMFNLERPTVTSGEITLLRATDSSFAIYLAGGDICVTWRPESLEADVEDGGYNKTIYDVYSGGTRIAYNSWIAIEYDPDTETESDGNPVFKLHRWTGSDWEELSWDSIDWYGEGFDRPDVSEWIFAKSSSVSAYDVHDFRVIVGDDSWTTTYQPGNTKFSIVPSELICWLNHDDNNVWPRDENCTELTFATDDEVDDVIAVSDRVTGDLTFKLEPYNNDIQWDACSHPDRYFYPTPEDIKTKPDGTVYGPTDSIWYEDSDGYPLIQNRMAARKKCSTIGTHKYVSGGGSLQRANVPNAPVAMPNPFVRCKDESFSSGVTDSTTPYEGELTWDTQYKFKVTLYDPRTGNESNPHGYFWFDTGDYSAAASSDTCSHSVTMEVEASINLTKYRLNFYRYHSSTGLYRYEGTSSIKIFDSDLDNSEGDVHTAEFTFALSDTDLALRSAIEEDNDEVPLHSYSALWAGRAWYVDMFNASRVRFSKLYYFAKCPASYVCWTDEGTSGDILGMMPGFGGLLLLKESSIWIVPQADNAAGFIAQLLIPDLGVVSADAAVFVNGALWFADKSGIYVFDGQSVSRVSDKLDGLDRNVWDRNARRTRAYYDKENWKVVFNCEGTAITFDSRNGAAALCSLPESCYGQVSSDDYSGPLYGHDGIIMEEVDGTLQLTCCEEDLAGFGVHGLTDTQSGDIDGTFTDIKEYWTDGTNSGNRVVGYSKTGIGDTTKAYLSYTGLIGQAFTQWTVTDISKTRDFDVSANIIHLSQTTGDVFFKSCPATSLSEYFIGILPLFSRSQHLYFGVDQDEKMVERLCLLFGDWVRGFLYNYYSTTGGQDEETLESNEYCPVFNVTFTAETLGEDYTSNDITSGDHAFVEDRYFMRLGVQRKGFRGYYTIKSYAKTSLPPVKSIFTHFTPINIGGGGRR